MQVKFFRGYGTYTFNDSNGFNTVPGQGVTFGFPVYLTGTVNFGMAPSHRITQRGPFQQGDTDIDFRLDPRIMSLPIVVPTSSIDDHFYYRNLLLNIFKPGNDAARLEVYFTDGATEFIRYIDVKILSSLTLDTDSKDFNIRGVIQLRADDPTWYDDFNFYETSLTSPVLGTPTPYPKPYEVPYGSAGIGGITNIFYEGTWISYPVLTATGPLTDLTITDGLGHVISFDTPIPAANFVIINLKYGAKTVVDQDGINRFAYLDINSDLIDWALYPSPYVVDGNNTISVSATGTDSNSSVVMNWFPRFIGV
jgi:hypothetical protein